MPELKENNVPEENFESLPADDVINQGFELTEDEAADLNAELNGENPSVHTEVGSFEVVDGVGMDSVMIWWNSVQKALNDANADIDLSRKEDLIRFRIAEILEFDTSKNSFTDAEVTSHLAFADNKDFDYAHASQADMLSAVNGQFTRAKIEELYNAAKEGLLFVNSLPEREFAPRQLVVNELGEAFVNPDVNHLTKEMSTAMSNCREPIKPSKPLALFTRILAFFGNENAKNKLAAIDRDYNQRMRSYQSRCKDWEASQKMDKDFVKQACNLNVSTAVHFNKPLSDEDLDREIHIIQIGTAAHKQYRVDALCTSADKAIESDCKALGEALGKGPGMTPEKELILADIFYRESIKTRITAKLNNDNLPEARIDQYEKQLEKGTPEYKKQIDLILDNKLFKRTVNELSEDELTALATRSEKPLGAVYRKFVKNMQEAPETHPQLDPVNVKPPVKDDTEVIRSKYDL